MIIAVDGPAASGKGTLARLVAAHYGLAHLDTGALYRAVAHALIAAGRDPGEEAAAVAVAQALDPTHIDAQAIRQPRVGQVASVIAAYPSVRAAILDFQRDFARSPPGNANGAVLDGRDIGTVVCPDADVKLFVTATPEVRAHRRYLEQRGRDNPPSEAEVLAGVIERDKRDSERTVSPLKAADDAHVLDTTKMDIETAFRAALDIIERVRAANGDA